MKIIFCCVAESKNRWLLRKLLMVDYIKDENILTEKKVSDNKIVYVI